MSQLHNYKKLKHKLVAIMKGVCWLRSKNYSVNELLHEDYGLLGYELPDRTWDMDYQTALRHISDVIATMRRKIH